MEKTGLRSSRAGRVLFVDLSQGKVTREPLPEPMRKDFLGGIGFNARMAYELIPAGADPLSPENAILIAPGALTGTMALGSPKTELVAKSPQTGMIGTALGGHFGAVLKTAGYDQLVITGRARSPVYLKVFDDDVELCPAEGLWGKDTYEATEALSMMYQPRECSIACIGPAGENLVRHALVLCDRVSTWGRAGLGAVWGSKNLKAIVCHGTRGVEVADPLKFGSLVDETTEMFLSDPAREDWTRYGTMVSWEPYSRMGNLTYKNWEEPFPAEESIRLYGTEAFSQHKLGVVSCPSCPSGCKAKIRVKGGEFDGLEYYVSCNLGGAMDFGARAQVGDYPRVHMCYSLANRLGLDHMTIASQTALLVELFQREVITTRDTDGLVLEAGFPTVLEVIKRTAYRQGRLGELLAQGWQEMVQGMGEEAEKRAVFVRGMDPPFEPRVSLGTENLGIFTCPRGGHPTMALSLTVVPGRSQDSIKRYCQRVLGVPEERIADIVTPAPGSYPGLNAGRLLRYVEDFNAVLSALGICSRPPIARLYTVGRASELATAATGLDLSPADLLRVGERTFTALALFNVRQGIDRRSLNVPQKFLTKGLQMEDREYPPLVETELDSLLDDYYQERGWDVDRGVPSATKLAELGLSSMSDALG